MDEPEITNDDFAELLARLPNDRGLFMEKEADKMFIRVVTVDDLVRLGEDPNLFHVVGLWSRPWVGYYANWLEYEHFPPDTPLNNDFQFRVFKWHDILWTIMSVPSEKRQLCYDAAEASHLHLADGVPTLSGDHVSIVCSVRKERLPEELKKIAHIFPLGSNNTFTLEQKRGDILYEPGGPQDARIEENLEIRKLWDKHEQL